jgi:hypothetical protein
MKLVSGAIARLVPVAMIVSLGVSTLLFAADKDARVTVLVHDVKLLPEDAKARAATLNESVNADTAVRTGDESRSELTFVDLTITRLGSNTIFSFNKAGRSVRLNSGAMLLRVPKDSGGAQMKTNACSVAISGTTVVLQATRAGRSKLYVLEGGARMALNKRPNEWATVGPGQMLDVPAGANALPPVQDFDVNDFMNTNPLVTDFPPLPSRNLISASNPPQRIYPSQPVAGGPARPAPPFVRPPPNPDGNNPPNGGGGSGRTRLPKKPAPPKQGATPTPVIGKQLPRQPGSKPSPTPRKRKNTG